MDRPKSEVLCKFYMNGACRNPACSFSHAMADLPNLVCNYYLQGCCKFGASCRYDHARPCWSQPRGASSSSRPPPPTPACPSMPYAPSSISSPAGSQQQQHPQNAWERGSRHLITQQQSGSDLEPPSQLEDEDGWLGPTEPAEVELCPWFTLRGQCPKGNKCDRIHGDQCEVCHRRALHPYNEQQQQQHKDECTRRHAKLQSRLLSADVECAICYEKVLSNSISSDRRFGLMSCEHPFCLKCIRSWRATSSADVDTAVRTCPVCRQTCFFVTPSRVWPTSAEEKEEIVSNYKEKLSTMDCSHFSQGEGTCPFGTSCFYRHAFPDGTLETRDVRRAKADEGSRVIGTLRLSSFFDTPGGQRLLRISRRHLHSRRQ